MTLMYLSGVTSDRDEPRLLAAGIGLMLNPGSGYARRVHRYPFWSADNGCFSDKWEEEPWMRWLETLPREGCLFAVAPDVYPDALGSLERGALYFDLIRDMGFPVAVVAQDGAEQLSYPWDDFDCMFIGGARTPNPRHEWKVSLAAESLVRRARREGKWVHMGRVNSLARMERARAMGCNSCDGTFIKYRRRTRAGEAADARDGRGAAELDRYITWLDCNPTMDRPLDVPSLPVYRRAAAAIAARPNGSTGASS